MFVLKVTQKKTMLKIFKVADHILEKLNGSIYLSLHTVIHYVIALSVST